MATGIGPEVWADAGEQAIVTAWDVLREMAKRDRQAGKGAGRQRVDGG